MPVTVTGIPETRSMLAVVLSAAGDPPSAHAATSQLIAGAARPPIATGALARSVRPFPGAGARVGSDMPYAALVEARTHFLARAVESTRPEWTAIYRDAVVAACQGA